MDSKNICIANGAMQFKNFFIALLTVKTKKIRFYWANINITLFCSCLHFRLCIKRYVWNKLKVLASGQYTHREHTRKIPKANYVLYLICLNLVIETKQIDVSRKKNQLHNWAGNGNISDVFFFNKEYRNCWTKQSVLIINLVLECGSIRGKRQKHSRLPAVQLALRVDDVRIVTIKAAN